MRDLVLGVVSWVPLVLVDGFAWLLAWTWWFLLPIRRRETADRFARSLPGVPPRPALTRMLHDVILGYVELLRWDRERAAGVAEPSVTVDMDASTVEPGSLLISGHGGSWDLGLLASAEATPVAIFLRTPADPWARDRLGAIRARHGVLALETGSTQADAYAALAAGRSVYFIQDQRFAKGLRSPFFGRPALTSAGIAAAYIKTRRPIYRGWPTRIGRGRHFFHFERWEPPALTGDKARDLQAVTDAVNGVYEDYIRARPHGWWWLHRRWKGGE